MEAGNMKGAEEGIRPAVTLTRNDSLGSFDETRGDGKWRFRRKPFEWSKRAQPLRISMRGTDE